MAKFEMPDMVSPRLTVMLDVPNTHTLVPDYMVGKVVKLVEPLPRMTITGVFGGYVRVDWHDGEGKPHTAVLPGDLLEHYYKQPGEA